jgi:hypothetical protein
LTELDEKEEDEAAFKQLQWATQALSQPPDVQLSLYPDFTNKPYELLSDFDNWYQATRWRKSLPISDIQGAELKKIFEFSQNIPEELLSEEAVKNDTTWAELRKKAGYVLTLFGWKSEPPPMGRSAYIPAGE